MRTKEEGGENTFYDMASNSREQEEGAAAARTADGGGGSPSYDGLGNLLGSYRSDDSGDDAEERRGEGEAPQSSAREDADEAAATATAAATSAAAQQPAASSSSPPPPLHQAAPQQQQRRDEQDPLWLPASLARRKRPGISGEVDPALNSKVKRMLEASAAGRSLSAELRRSRAYRNPYFLEKMVDHLGLDPRASRLRAPRGYEGKKEEGTEEEEEGKTVSSFAIPEDTADALELEEAAARRAASSAVTGRVEFVSQGGGGGGGGGGRRGRRWD